MMLVYLWYSIHMKPIQVTFDEDLLTKFDELSEVRERGRSAVLRQAAADYLARKTAEEIDRQYAEGYGRLPQTDEELDWGESRVWPEDSREGDD